MNKLFIFLLLIVLIGCKKEVDKSDTTRNIDEKINTAPKVFAGNNIKVTLPEDSVKLEATVIDAENNIAGYIWKKISGPVSYRLINGNSVHSKVFELQEGIYQFELTVTDKGALEGKDTITITVNPLINTAPKVSAGNDTTVILPANNLLLTGSAIDADKDIESYLWQKISGPSSVRFENETSIVTKVYDLKQGTYEFELTVTDKQGLKGKDTLTAYIYNSIQYGTNEIIFSNLSWDCPWGCYTEIVNFDKYIPSGTSFKVFIKYLTDTIWTEVKHNSATSIFTYGVSNNILYIVSSDPMDLSKHQVKLVF